MVDHAATLRTLLTNDALRRNALRIVAQLDMADCWIGAGFIRDAIWDYLHGYPVSAPDGDVDVVWFDRSSLHEQTDRDIERRLYEIEPALRWSVKNQARMHLRNADPPYLSVADAMRHWPETATAIAARMGPSGSIEISAPFGLDDLFVLRLRPTPTFVATRMSIFSQRASSKRWLERYPLLSVQNM